jgi:radical SAM protein (TIGR01212 family)
MKYLAYFKAYSNTYASFDVLRHRYEEALSVEDVVGLVIGTRPDCIEDDVLQYLADLQDKGFLITLELGIESFYDKTLQRINRGHSVEDSLTAIQRCADAGINTTIHLILGLPGETKADILAETDIINDQPIQSIKLHQLQILEGTVIAQEFANHPEDFLSMNIDEYASLVAEFISRLRKDIHIERFASSAPSDLIIAPRWGLKPSEVQQRIEEKLSLIG